MGDQGWAAAIPSAIITFGIWYQNRASNKRKGEILDGTASEADMKRALKEIEDLKSEIAIFKGAYFKSNPVTDHRSPK